MPKHLIAVELTERFRLKSGTTGETFTITGATKPDGTSWTGPDVAEIGGGTYELSFTPALTGVYLATLTGNTSGEVFSGSWEVVDTPAIEYVRHATGEVIAASHMTELQQGLEEARKMLGLD